jgi:hemoglobin
MSERSLFDELGGTETLKRVHKIFYDKIYAHPWIGQFFAHVSQEIIESQQSDFMAQAMGGPARYCGAFPVAAHKHMNISQELFELRHSLLVESLREAGLSDDHQAKWLRIDGAFKAGIVKKSFSDCEKRFTTDEILDFQKPFGSKKAA